MAPSGAAPRQHCLAPQGSIMKHIADGLCLALLMLTLSGCSGARKVDKERLATRESLAKEQAEIIGDLAGVFEKAADAEEAKPKLETLLDKMKEWRKGEDALGEPANAEEEAVEKKYSAELKPILTRFKKALADFRPK